MINSADDQLLSAWAVCLRWVITSDHDHRSQWMRTAHGARQQNWGRFIRHQLLYLSPSGSSTYCTAWRVQSGKTL